MSILLALLLAAVRPEPTPAADPLTRGEQLLSHKQYAAAEKELRLAVDADPKSARAHGNLALALLPQRRIPEAVDEGRLAAAFGPRSAEARFIYGLTLTAAGKPIEAAREYEEVVALKPGQAGPLAALASAYAAAEDARTVATYEKLIALEPSRPDPRRALAEYLWATEKTAQGNAVIVEAIASFPADSSLALAYGRALAGQERLEEAARQLEKARSLGATDSRTLALLANVCERAGKPDEAAAAYEAALQADPEDAALRHDLGRLYLAAGRPADALRELERAVRSNGAVAAYQLDYGRALEAAGNLPGAEKAYRRAVELSPNLPGAHFALGRLLQREGKTDEAGRELATHHALYERALDAVSASNAQKASAALAWKQLEAGKTSDALARFRSLPESPDSLRGQALALSRLGRHAEAVRALEKALQLAPDDAPLELLLLAERSRAAGAS